MAGFRIQSDTEWSSDFSKMADRIDKAGHRCMVKLVHLGYTTARSFAPEGPGRSDYGRRPKLKSNIQKAYDGAKSGYWFIDAVNALSQETGAAGHLIEGNPNLKFFHESKGYWVVTPAVQHPGNAAQPYMEPSFAVVDAEAEAIMAETYGGV